MEPAMDDRGLANDDLHNDSLEEYEGDAVDDINDPNNTHPKNDRFNNDIHDQHQHQPQHPHHHYNGGMNNDLHEEEKPEDAEEVESESDDNSEAEEDGQNADGQDVDYGRSEQNRDPDLIPQQQGQGHVDYDNSPEQDRGIVQNQEDVVKEPQNQNVDDASVPQMPQQNEIVEDDRRHLDENVGEVTAAESCKDNENGAALAVAPEGVAPITTGESTPTATMTPSTPPPSQPSSTSTPKSIKQRLSEIPKRLSRLSLLNALRSGTYVVSEPKNNVNDEDDLEAQNNMADEAQPEELDLEANNKVNDKEAVANNDSQEEPLNKIETDPDVAALNNMTKRRHSVHRSALTRLLCGLYALILVVFGIVFALANSLTVKEREHLYYLEVFQIYLYVGSLVVLLYFQVCILRGVRIRNNYFESNIRVVIRRSQDNLQLTPSPTRKQNHDENHQGHSIVLTDAEEALLDSKRDPMDQLSTLSTRSQLGLPADGEVAHVGEGINFYLRLGALAFSIGSVTLDGFHIASYFETENTTTCESLIFIFVYVLHLIFTFVQTFFLFKNHKLVIDKNKASVRFGLMHLLATNLCVWCVTAITETAEDYNQQKFFSSYNASVPRGPDEPKSCYEDMTLARTASPYLFPSTIIYSIIAAGILYRMYQYVGVKVTQRWPSHTSLTSSVPHGAVGMDCEKANKGLFSGLLVAVVTLIAIATFFVFESRLDQTTNAIKIFYVTEISLIAITGSCIIFGVMKFVQLKFLENFLSLDSVLLVVSLGGAYVYLCFMLISSASKVEAHGMSSILSLVVICVGILESTLQTIFILDGLCRRASNDGHVEAKPGRAIVTFVLVCNLALWVVSMFEMKKNMVVPFHIEFYGILPWNIILHLCVPLFIYFRFHSAICLSKIWYQAYQKEKNF